MDMETLMELAESGNCGAKLKSCTKRNSNNSSKNLEREFTLSMQDFDRFTLNSKSDMASFLDDSLMRMDSYKVGVSEHLWF